MNRFMLSVAAIALTTSAAFGQDPADPPPAPDPNADAMQAVDTPTFIADATRGHPFETGAGQVATEKATSEEVRNFGQMLVVDHTEAGERLLDTIEEIDMVAAIPER